MHATTTPLFFFGSLMDKDVLEIVLGRDIDQSSLNGGILHGYQCEKETKESYPVLIPCENGQAIVLIAEGLIQEDVDRILFYETGEYEFSDFPITTGKSEIIARGFATGEGISSSGERWHLNIWQEKDKAGFLPLAKRFMEGYGKMTIPEALIYWDELVLELSRTALEDNSVING